MTAKILKIPAVNFKSALQVEQEIKAIRLRLTLAIIEDILKG